MTTTSLSPAARTGNWSELPPELLTPILQRGGAFLMLSARKVCKAWHRICSDPDLWRVLDLRCSGYGYGLPLETMARQAVDLSCGQLVDLTIALWATDRLLLYISQRSSQLRRLHLISSVNFTYLGLVEVVKRLPLLEELHFHRIFISDKVIEAAGQCCPQLKSFKLTSSRKRDQCMRCDEEAEAVAKNMPGLRHLQLIANPMYETGLQAILDNCPHLESLDILLPELY
ncbi:putative F-box/LRR-repeat protein 23 [Heracleum sosnowskyi]|uniref:F-box/LRR-repeat protein 23 n=1 Tax=Heracleum sosnowskyi TaxID=360622 RepID=A0AAD8M8M4_9APIA|nr:putative F-box/LRR-repeat protein 23 [Heracleum sosnowskyi]